jgi:hypothetical protein
VGCTFTEPFDHSSPVNHAALQVQLHDWPDECIWAQLQYERWAAERTEHKYTTPFLENLEREWERRGICSRCHREIDTELNQQISELERRTQTGEDKLTRIRRLMAVTPDAELRPKIMQILDER